MFVVLILRELVNKIAEFWEEPFPDIHVSHMKTLGG